MKRGEIWIAALDPTIGSEIRKTRPAIIVQNDVGNAHSPTTIIVPITSRNTQKIYPMEVLLTLGTGLEQESKALCDQVRTIDKRRLQSHIGAASRETMARIDAALKVSLDLV